MSAYRTETQVKLAYEVAREEYLRAVRVDLSAALVRAVLPGIFLVLATIGGLMALRLALGPWLLANGVVLVVVGALVVSSLRGTRRALDRRWQDLRTMRLEATEDGLEVHGGESGKRIAWPLVVSWRETEEAFHLFVDNMRFHLIPKRAFPGPESITVFRRLLEDRVPPNGEARRAAARRRAWVPFVVIVGIFAVIVATAVEAAAALLAT